MRLLSLALALGLVGCNGDSLGSPSAIVTGQWTLNLTNFVGSGLICNASGVTLQLTQAGTTFTGTYSGGNFDCTSPGGPLHAAGSSGQIINGNVSGTAVDFDVDTPDSHFVGGISGGGSMAGTGTEHTSFNGTTVVLSGTWSATKAP